MFTYYLHEVEKVARLILYLSCKIYMLYANYMQIDIDRKQTKVCKRHFYKIKTVKCRGSSGFLLLILYFSVYHTVHYY